jgi:predicted Rossmann fold nucleotide-binding protein DprA/Smf involved in DNA uptake
MAERLGRDLAARGLLILSGLAWGIDAIGHHVPWRQMAARLVC